MKRIFLATLAAVVFSTLGVGAVRAAVINFEDIAVPGCCAFLPNGPYQGFTFSAFWVIGQESADNFPGQEAYSGANFAWSNGAEDISLSGGTFSFNSLWARLGSDLPGSATARGFNGVTEIFTQVLDLTDNYQFFSLNFAGITSWTLTDQSTNVLLDDITVNVSAIPVPAALPLLLTALGGLGFAGLRRRKAA